MVALLNEVADRKCVTGGITGGKALVGHVKEGEDLLLLDNVGDLLPLFGSGVDTGRVVRASVEEDDGLLWDSLRYDSDQVLSPEEMGERTFKSSFRPAMSRPTVFLSK